MTTAPLLLGARLLAAGLFLVAGCAKLLGRAETASAAEQLGLPRRAAALTAAALPGVELALAAGLIVGGTARPAAGAVLVLSLGFAALNVKARSRGHRPSCHCFGELLQLHAGYGIAVLDAVIAAVAALVLGFGPGSAVPAHGPWGALLALGALGCAAAPISARLLTAIRDLRRRCGNLEARLRTLETAAGLGADGASPVGGPEAGAPAPDLDVLDAQALTRTLRPRASRDLLLLFLEPGCAPCERVLAEAGAWQRTARDRLTLWFVYGASAQAAARAAAEYGLDDVYAQSGRRAAESYRVPGTPSGVLIDADGRVAVPLVAGYGAVRDLVQGYLPPRSPGADGARERNRTASANGGIG
ncbi:MAG TPA: MauE/DoxX family redox-associated membrane protein [Actinospica sp.]|nr:MauE/DoxX family redox-associated membrane protein [Actinospica sp.]